ncbi:MAG: hypothetical protein J5I59_11670 [Saprospiraceae bacterium]|nr:hypothetical protein [Saprospiraceae bacterium]
MKKFTEKYMKLVSVVIPILAFTFLSSCSKDDDRCSKEKLIGKWNWVNSIGGHTGDMEENPQLNGYSLQYLFKANDSIIITKDYNTIIHKGKYHLTRENSILFQKEYEFLTIDYLYFDEDNNPVILPKRYIIDNLSSDNLKLTEDVFDGYVLTFTR